MKRQKHSLSNYKLLTCDMGELVPVCITDVLPGDAIQQSTSMLIRVSPLLAPVMHPVSVRIHHWFVPYRLLWDGWEDFITGGPLGTDTGAGFPTMTGPFAKGTIADYFGIPVDVAAEVNAMPFNAYNLIFNEFYRDQDLVSERSPTDTALAVVAWEKDYFTSARPWAQKGPEVTLPIGSQAVVTRYPNAGSVSLYQAGSNMNAAGGSLIVTDSLGKMSNGVTEVSIHPNGTLYADLANATAANVNDIRRAFALQRYAEARAQYGSRYSEYLRYLGLRSSDARLQRPEYLGGGKQTIHFSEVLKTGAGEDPAEPIGSMKGHGIAAMRSGRYRRFFEEHGVVLSLMSVRPKAIYSQGLHRMWSKRSREDYWQKELEHIGQQEIMNSEIYAQHTTPTGLFGYQDRYSEYRSTPSTVAADFRDTLDYWHQARSFAAAPVLNASFVQCDPSKRIYAEQTQDALWVMANNSIQARRMVTNNTSSKIY